MRKERNGDEYKEIRRASCSIEKPQTDKEILEVLSDYHENDIADMLAGMNEKERKRLYRLLGTQRTAEIFAYLDEPQAYLMSCLWSRRQG